LERCMQLKRCCTQTNSRSSIHMSAKNCNWFLPGTALISVLLSVSPLSAQNHSDVSRSQQWRIAGQNLSNTWSQPPRPALRRSRRKLTNGILEMPEPTEHPCCSTASPRPAPHCLRNPHASSSANKARSRFSFNR
jgi:hypothetical protein